MMRFNTTFSLFFCAAIRLSAFSITEGNLQFSYDEPTGSKVLSCAGSTLELKPVEVTLYNSASPIVLKRVSHKWDSDKRVLQEIYDAGAMTVTERTRFSSSYAIRSVELLADASLKRPLKLKAVAFPSRIRFKGEYFLIASEKGNGALFDPEMRGRIPESGHSFNLFHPNDSFAPLFLAADTGASWFFISDGSMDRCSSGIISSDGKTLAVQRFAAAGWLEPGIPQDVGTAEVTAVKQELKKAIRTLPAKWYKGKGIVPPQDRPEWIFDAVMYSCHPLGTLWSGLSNLGGFVPARTELLPLIKELGFNTVWFLPLEDQWIYWPRDYFKFNKRLEGEREYFAFVSAAHQNNVRVIQDIVPHGGSPSCGQLRGNSPFNLCFDEKGQVQNYWCFDFGDRNWQDYIGRVAGHYMDKFGLDGLRIDAVKGNHYLNWKRPGIPAERPRNVDKKWWNDALEKSRKDDWRINYPRASMGMRAAGLEMMDVIHRQVKAKNNTGITMAETNCSLAIRYSDIIYDSQFNHLTIQKMRELPLDHFASGYMERMEEQLFTDPPGLLRMRCIDNHDTTNLLGLYGLAAWKSLYASIFAVPGMPMIYHDKEIFQGPFLAKLIEIRKELPELRRGKTSYPRVTSSSSEVFSIYREYDGKATLALINFSPELINTKIVFPEGSKEQFPAKKELMTGTTVTDRITLSPWQAAFIAMRKNAEELPVTAPLYSAATPAIEEKNGEVTVTPGKDAILVRTSSFEVSISLADGMLQGMRNHQGPLLGKVMFSHDNKIKTNLETQVKVDGRSINCSSGNLQWKWICGPDRITLDISANRNKDTDLSIVFPAMEVSRWQVGCAEGRIDDFFHTRHSSGKPGSLPGYRLRGDNVVWNAETMPISLNDPSIKAMNRNGCVNFKFVDITGRPPANIRVLDRFDGMAGWSLSLALSERAIVPVFPKKPEGRISLEISVAPPSLPALAEDYTPLTVPGIGSVGHNSLNWIVKGKFGEISLTRAGGMISELKNPEGKCLLKNGTIYTNKGFGRKNSTKSRVGYPYQDTETGMMTIRDGEALKLCFYGQLRDNGCWKPIEQPIWFINEYSFLPDGSIRSRNAFYSEGNPLFPKGFLAWRGKIPGIRNVSFNNGDFNRVPAYGKGRSNRFEPGIPASMTMNTVNGKLKFTHISAEGPEPLKVFFDNHNVFFAWMDGATDKFHAGTLYAISFDIMVGK